MSTNELLEQARFLVDAKGNKTAIVLDIDVWQQLLREISTFKGNAVQESSAPVQDMPIRIPSIWLTKDSPRPEVTVEVE